MLALLMGWGLSSRAAKAVAYVAVPLAVIALLWLGLHLYGNSRYNAGVHDTDAKWQEASDRLKAQAAQSATRADDAAAERLGQFKQQVEDEKEAMDAAASNGSSVFDVLF